MKSLPLEVDSNSTTINNWVEPSMFTEGLGCDRCTDDGPCNFGIWEVDVDGLNKCLES